MARGSSYESSRCLFMRHAPNSLASFRPCSPRFPDFVHQHMLNKKRACEHVDAARRRAVPVGELMVHFRREKLLRRTNPDVTSLSLFDSQTLRVSGNLTLAEEETDDNSDEEKGRRQRSVFMRGESRLSPVATCRQHSTSAWLHFPHVELVVLFFAFEGAVASFASAMRHSECPEFFYAALVALVSAGAQPNPTLALHATCANEKSYLL